MTPFADLAAELRSAATREAYSFDALELLAAKSGEPSFVETLANVRLSGARLGEAYELLKALIPHEAAVRRLVVQPVRHEAA